ncbi:MAG: 2-hydroxy-3-oxopropionate reductase [Actinomycetota bacterium]|nr:2-hydroxy-3-oxopropionate reductase [Actinomycetota bacterium]
MKVAFIGLGVMGAPMARNLVKAGHEVTGFDVVDKGVQALVEAGGKKAESIKAALEGAEVAITMLPDSPQVEAVAFGEEGLLASAKAGLLYIDNSSIAPPVARRVSAAARERGLRPLDAPVSGGEAGAIEGSLSIMVGGKAEDFEEARPLLEAMGSTVAHVGGDGAGQTVKVANQLVVAGVIEAVAEATVLLQASDVDVPAALDVLAGGLAGNRILDRKRASMLAGDFKPGFRVDLHHKDLGNLLATAREAGVSLPLGGLVAELMAALRARGGGSLDHSALLLLVQAMSGRDGSATK